MWNLFVVERFYRTRLGMMLALPALVAGCGVGELDDYAPLTLYDNFHAIERGTAYRSAQLDSTTMRLVLDEYDIKTVINLRGENPERVWYVREREAVNEAGATLVDIAMSAHSLPPREKLLALYDTFQTAEYPILMHCQAGADRSGAAAAIWRMVMRGDSREDAAWQLSPLFGHITAAAPEMDELVAMFEPSREWIVEEYLRD